MKFTRKPMVNWYDLKQLASTGIKTMISGVFGNFADKREFQAAYARGEKPFVIDNDKEEIWIDYISDLGDGFDATYTMAHLLAQDTLTIDNTTTQRGRILIMGGDEVYPTPERREYENRLKGPYANAFPWEQNIETSLFVIPGNHDWYDGLTNFMKVFCQGRSIGNWLTEQKRSYFALKLPHNYWVFGIDIQLHADIDEPQLDYFRKISREQMQKGDKVILCTAEPSWVYKSWSMKNTSDDRMRFFIDNIILGATKNYYGREEDDVQVVAILTGDMHHYSHYEEKIGGIVKSHLITAGGGGAFTHPTHFLKANVEAGDNCTRELTKNGIYPTRKQSLGLGWWNLAFPAYSPHMLCLFAVLHLFTIWNLQIFDQAPGSFLERLGELETFSAILDHIYNNLKYNPAVVFLHFVLLIGLTMFSDTFTVKWSWIIGFMHGLLQLVISYIMIYFIIGFVMDIGLDLIWGVFTFAVLGGLVSAFIFGLYLLVSTLVIHNHPTEAFSSFRWKGYKNFLRIHITNEGATIYPIGLKKVSSWTHDFKPKGSPPKPIFIEDPFKIDS
ncbi:metallophosphoesterase [Fulvivirga sp. RKSG066]|uniref:metallophosphoesterase n=1 Tax=Fulvivirga aurantia TaxID=2529383 RepID=UPI0012BCF74A|nr:metallophosphoesterase [Fulvivirga aurantia]MTI23153.1 metallophosphoesterase [Fulvivirga aurantia]